MMRERWSEPPSPAVPHLVSHHHEGEVERRPPSLSSLIVMIRDEGEVEPSAAALRLSSSFMSTRGGRRDVPQLLSKNLSFNPSPRVSAPHPRPLGGVRSHPKSTTWVPSLVRNATQTLSLSIVPKPTMSLKFDERYLQKCDSTAKSKP